MSLRQSNLKAGLPIEKRVEYPAETMRLHPQSVAGRRDWGHDLPDTLRMQKGRDGDSYLAEVTPSELEKVRTATAGRDAVNRAVHPPKGQKGNLHHVQPEGIVQTSDDGIIGNTGFC